MPRFYTFITSLLISAFLITCNPKTSQPDEAKGLEAEPEVQEEGSGDQVSLFGMDNLLAWCIVPFDSNKRSPEKRIMMLKELGFQSYAYDWRNEHLAEMEKELKLAAENEVEVKAVWLWIDANSDGPGKLSAANEKMLSIIKNSGLHTQVWVGFHANYFDGMSDEEAVRNGIEMVRYLGNRAAEIGCRLALYNHGDWFGEPANQVKIIEKLPDLDIGIIYNFHHAHGQIIRLPEIINVMKPYLWVVNLNGMRKEGPKILPLGTGDQEKKMIDLFIEAGYTGPWGILGHVEDADVQKILEANLKGLKSLYE